MKKIFCLLAVILVFITLGAQVPIRQVDSLVNVCRQKVDEIDNQILYKTYIDYNGYTLKYNPIEWLYTLYFDAKGRLKKTRAIYQKEDYESCWMYYDSTGIAMYTSYYACSMNGMYSIERYLDEEEKLLYLNHVAKEDERHPTSPEHIIYEQIIRRASPGANIPIIDYGFYDRVFSRNDFVNLVIDDIRSAATEGKIVKPENTQPVKFIAPEKGDTTSLNQNDVFIYQKPTLNSRIIDKLYIRRDIVIQDKKDEWYKIALAEPWGKKLEGYIHKDYLAPVEKVVE